MWKGAVQRPDKLLGFLRANCPDAPSVKAIKRAIDAKQCKVNGRVECFSTYPLRVGDRVELNLSVPKKPSKMKILHEDEKLVAFNKPAGLVTEAPDKLFLVHRLDKETSGVLLCAKSEEAQKHYIALFAERKVEKRYLALCDGHVAANEWTVENFLIKKSDYDGGALYGSTPAKGGKKAITSFRCLGRGKDCTLLICRPVTGRTHQIRVHLKESGYPILGDWQYNRSFLSTYPAARHLLHSREIRIDGLKIIAPLPHDFVEALERLFDGSYPDC